MNNLILKTDSYKLSHYKQYPPGTETVYSYFESRGGKYDEIVFFGLQYIILKHLINPVTVVDVNEAHRVVDAHMGPGHFNREGWDYIVKEHGGRLPIRIKAVAEGSVIPTSNVLMTVENTDPKCFWLTNYLETILSQVWYPCTVATQSRQMKKDLLWFLEETGDPSLIDFKLHDFGYRGSTSNESAGIGGAAHLVNFKGTDTLAAILAVQEAYDRKCMAGHSIPAAEHSTITSWGKENELEAYKNMLEQYPTGLVAVVSDSYDIYNACSELWGKQLKSNILDRDGTLVVRPDSGDPEETVVKVLDLLGEAFGYTENEKGYKVLPPQIRVIQGDGITAGSMHWILRAIHGAGWSTDNIAFGSGGGLLQKVDRDTCKFAFKCSAIKVNGEWRDVYKDPVTDPGKVSKKGRLALVQVEPEGEGDFDWHTGPLDAYEEFDELETVYENGVLTKIHTFDEIREKAKV